VPSLLIEDVLVFRHHSGQQALVAPSVDQPCTFVVAGRWQDLQSADAPIGYLWPIQVKSPLDARARISGRAAEGCERIDLFCTSL
jgi:hypothetical protein